MKTYIKHYLLQSVYDVFKNAFEIEIKALAQPSDDAKLSYATLNILQQNNIFPIYVGINSKTISELATVYFGDEEKFSKEELEDFLKETTNMIVGKMKMLISDHDSIAIELDTPKLIHSLEEDKLNAKKYFKVNGHYIVVAY